LKNSYFEDSSLNFAELEGADTTNVQLKNTELKCFNNAICENNEE